MVPGVVSGFSESTGRVPLNSESSSSTPDRYKIIVTLKLRLVNLYKDLTLNILEEMDQDLSSQSLPTFSSI